MPRKTLKILIANGVNLDLLGRREPDIYGTRNLRDVERLVRAGVVAYSREKGNPQVRLRFFQTNDEAKFLAELSKGYDGAVINAGAWTHTSLAIADRLAGLSLPFVEVHISDLSKREKFRQFSFMAAHAIKVVSGQGVNGYSKALAILLKSISASG